MHLIKMDCSLVFKKWAVPSNISHTNQNTIIQQPLIKTIDIL